MAAGFSLLAGLNASLLNASWLIEQQKPQRSEERIELTFGGEVVSVRAVLRSI